MIIVVICFSACSFFFFILSFSFGSVIFLSLVCFIGFAVLSSSLVLWLLSGVITVCLWYVKIIFSLWVVWVGPGLTHFCTHSIFRIFPFFRRVLLHSFFFRDFFRNFFL